MNAPAFEDNQLPQGGVAHVVGSTGPELWRRTIPDVLKDTAGRFADREAAGEDAEAPNGLWATLAWFAVLLVLSSLLGFILALAVFLLSFMRVRAGLSWMFATIYTAAGITFMCAMAGILNRDFPPGMLQSWVELPWPFN